MQPATSPCGKRHTGILLLLHPVTDVQRASVPAVPAPRRALKWVSVVRVPAKLCSAAAEGGDGDGGINPCDHSSQQRHIAHLPMPAHMLIFMMHPHPEHQPQTHPVPQPREYTVKNSPPHQLPEHGRMRSADAAHACEPRGVLQPPDEEERTEMEMGLASGRCGAKSGGSVRC
ncbi:hypothetical protein B0H11DRAFT_1306191 [Mycena galericulata]|nr:hypothetical protein B0H11DRAFT_1306191 [Mycena galericulata]